MLVIGIDVGGTQVKFGLVEDGKIIRTMELGTNTFDIIRQLCNGAREIVQASERSWNEVDGVAVGFPGMVIDSVVLDSPNISLQNCNLKEILENELGKVVVVKNDAEMATIAEHRIGSGAGCENMVLITLGTGVGGGIIIDKKLYVGAGGAGELGHIMFEKNGRACTCGRKGCAEQYVSMKALDSLAKDIMVGYPNTCVDFNGDGLIYASELARAYKRNDACAIEIVDKYVDDLTQFLLDLCNLFRPNRIVIGGGITHAPELIDMVARNCRRLEYGYKNSPKVDILTAQLGNQAGILGGFVCLQDEINGYDKEEIAEESTEDINSQQQNLSLLDSISRRLDGQLGSASSQLESVPGVDNNSFIEADLNGLYVNKILDDISTEINTIKNEQLLGEVEDNVQKPSEEPNSYTNESLVNVYESNTVIEEQSNPGSFDNNAFMSAVSSINETTIEEPVVESVEVDSVVNNEELNENQEEEYDDEDNLSLGLNDIFFGTSAELEKKLDEVDISNVNIVDNNIVETAPVVEDAQNETVQTENMEESSENSENNGVEQVDTVESPIQDNSMYYGEPITDAVATDLQSQEEDSLEENAFGGFGNLPQEPFKPVDNSIFVPTSTYTENTSQDNFVEENTSVQEADNNASVDPVSNSVNSDYARLLDAMGKFDLSASQEQDNSNTISSGENLLSRVNKMLDNKDE